MIDIHTHLIPFVDDGSPSFEISLEMLKKECEFGVTDIILTPHKRRHFDASIEAVDENFDKLVQLAKEQNININLYKGRELHIDHNYIKNLSVKDYFLCNTKYVLVEFPEMEDCPIDEYINEIIIRGYIPIVAHFERYSSANIEIAEDIKSMGALIQINAASVLGKSGFWKTVLVKRLLKYDLVDFIASDIHHNRTNYLNKAYSFVMKKYGKEKAEKLFTLNAKKIIEG